MTAIYNDSNHDAPCTPWLEELVARNLIAPGVVDDRSIDDLTSEDLVPHTQVHLCAGIGGWSLALRLAGWPDNMPVWTCSVPCPSFSAAGKQRKFDDPRHKWPEVYRLVRAIRPPVILGEQVDAATGPLQDPGRVGRPVDTSGDPLDARDPEEWLALVQDDLETEGYLVGSVVVPACGVGAPHRRQRLYWFAWRMADANCVPGPWVTEVEGRSVSDGSSSGRGQGDGQHTERCEADGVADGDGQRCEVGAQRDSEAARPRKQAPCGHDADGCGQLDWSNATNGFWRDPDWVGGEDRIWRPVGRPRTLASGVPRTVGRSRPGSVLEEGAPHRVARITGYGNALTVPQAAAFIRAVMDTIGMTTISDEIREMY